MTFASVLLVGFLLGLKHATEADHLAAVATLLSRRGSWTDALRHGIAWGVGHTVTLLLVGGVALALGRAVPPYLDRVLEAGVGLMLVGLGIDVLRRLARRRIHFHAHTHGDGLRHFHAHHHAAATKADDEVPTFAALRFVLAADPGHADEAHDHVHPHRLPGRALLVGMMHGVAGSAALIVLTVGAAPSVATGALYLLVFGAGSVAGMALLSIAIGWPLRASGAGLAGLHRALSMGVGALSCGLGLLLLGRNLL